MKITGDKFLVEFGTAKAILHFKSETLLTFTIIQRDGNEVNISETVEIKMTEIRPRLYMVTWKEKNGNTVTQIQDYENSIVYSNWTLPGGEFHSQQGTLKQIAN